MNKIFVLNFIYQKRREYLLGRHLCLFSYRHMVYCQHIGVLQSSSLLIVLFMYSWFSSISVLLKEQRFIIALKENFYLKQDVFGTWKTPGAFVW